MNYFAMMTEDEIKYVCSVIPLQESVGYFKRYPTDFAKVMPGFRATSLKNQERVSALLYRSRKQPFISTFIEKQITRWLDEIHREIKMITGKGESKESAWFQVLPFCFFVDDIGIFFKLISEDLPESYISLLSESIRRIKDLDVSSKKLEIALTDKDLKLKQFEDGIKHLRADLEKSRKTLVERSSQIKTLKRSNANIEKLESIVRSREQEIEVLKNKAQERHELIQNLKDELSAVKNQQQQYEIKLREELEKQRAFKLLEQAAFLNPRGPVDIDEFRDYLGYNIESLGVATTAEYYSLLKDCLCEILFTGKPILVTRNTGMILMQCIGNALIGSANVASLVFRLGISEPMIDEFLSAKNRILCLDNFIGNFNETILSTICDKHKDKIIFLTVAYDKTLRYVPEEFLKYCHYINLNRIDVFAHDCLLTEDPSSVDEIEFSNAATTPDILWVTFLKEVLDEIGISGTLSLYKSNLISDEASLCRLLAFDILPFCTDVLGISPFAVSERLNKYAGDKGRCSYKELFRRWFT